jgi:hypothetical protein
VHYGPTMHKRPSDNSAAARRSFLGASIGAVAAGAVTTLRPTGAARAAGSATDTRAAATTASGKAAPLGTYPQSESVINVPDLWLPDDGTAPHPAGSGTLRRLGPALQRALSMVRSSSTTVALGFPSGDHLLPSFTIDRPVKLVSSGPPTAAFGTTLPSGSRVWGGAMLYWDGAGDDPFVTVHANGVALVGIGLHGGDRRGTALRIELGYELQLDRVRAMNWDGPGLVVDHAGNATFDDVHLDRCGSAGRASAMIVNSFPPPELAAGVRTNTLDFTGLTIEQSRHTALEIGVDPSRNQATANQLPAFLRFDRLHIESVPANATDPTPAVPAIVIGVAVGITMTAPFVYAGPGPLVRHEEPTTRAGASEGVVIVGGTLLGKGADVLVDLVRGDVFAMSAVRLRGLSSGSTAVVAGAQYRGSVRIDAATQMLVTAGEPMADRRTATRAPFRVHGDVAVGGALVSSAPAVLAATPTGVASTATSTGSDELRGTVHVVIGKVGGRGDLVVLVLDRGASTTAVALVGAADSPTAAARPYGRTGKDARGRLTITLGIAEGVAAGSAVTIQYLLVV